MEDLSIFLAERREDVLIALQAKKPKPVAKKKPAMKAVPAAKLSEAS